MSLTIAIKSDIDGEIQRFLDSFYGKRIIEDENVYRWEQVFIKPMDALDIICASVDNMGLYHIITEILISDYQWYQVSSKNIDFLVKDFFEMFYVKNTYCCKQQSL
jgi:hypothetical protein